jgi:K+/H+ antiporter YhaU regulatory subunit KhtT
LAAIAAALVAIVISLLVTRIAALALTATGMNRQIARFQARSAFTGVGFTTSEAEDVVHHPVRRRIIMLLMLLGNAGIITIAATLILSFAKSGRSSPTLLRVSVLLGGLSLILVAANSSVVDRHLSRLISKALGRWTDLGTRDWARLLQLAGDYGIAELAVRPHDWLAGKTLGELKLRDEGVVVLGILNQDGSYVGVPDGDTQIGPNDTLILYGRSSQLGELDRRQAGNEGDQRHKDAVGLQEKVEEQEATREREDQATGSEEQEPTREREDQAAGY